jgi:predicted nucleic acid-binding protein
VRVYAETNFVLELVLEQGELSDSQELIDLARRGDIELVLPAVALFEAYSTIHRRAGERRELTERVDRELVQVGRSLTMASEAASVRGLLVRASDLVRRSYDDVRDALLTHARWVPLDAGVLSEARAAESRHGLSVPDAIVLASMITDLRSRGRSSCLFVTKNSKDFGTPDVRADLDALGCDLVFKVAAALARVRASLGNAEV